MKTRYAILPLVLAGALITALATRQTQPGGSPDAGATDALKFSHKYHVKEAGIACADCHVAAKTSKEASDNLHAGHDQCKTCHEDQVNNTCGYCHANPDDIQPVQLAERKIFFAHEKHLAMKGVECATCHTGIEDAERPSQATIPEMESCTSCHNGNKAPSTCESCHVTLAGLVPKDHLVANFKREHKQLTRLGDLETRCATCHTENFCADCHEDRGLLGFGVRDLMTDPAVRGSASDGPKQLSLALVHDLNYRFTHGMDAKGRSADCYTCHSASEFCAECHTTGGIINPNGFKPAWHLGAGFTTIGPHSGGGRHADYARRDMESCISCHDVQGGDPTCIQCHVDGDGIRGTDPKTHESGFMSTEHGSWHTSEASPCYNCHTDMNAHPGGVRGRGFCGYCHS
jgi:c(7)-type cytochrome triheme protein